MSKPKTALRLLEELKHKEKSSRSTMPPSYIPRTKYSDDDANSLTTAIIDYIDLIGGWATRISVEGRYIEKLGTRVRSSVKRGTADIHAVYRGKHLSIEVKIGKDRQSEEQKEIEQEIISAGGLYFIARNFQDFYDWFSPLEQQAA